MNPIIYPASRCKIPKSIETERSMLVLWALLNIWGNAMPNNTSSPKTSPNKAPKKIVDSEENIKMSKNILA